MAAYYPRKVSTIQDLRDAYKEEFDVDVVKEEHLDWEEEQKMYDALIECVVMGANGLVVLRREGRVRRRRRGRRKVRTGVPGCSTRYLLTWFQNRGSLPRGRRSSWVCVGCLTEVYDMERSIDGVWKRYMGVFKPGRRAVRMTCSKVQVLFSARCADLQ